MKNEIVVDVKFEKNEFIKYTFVAEYLQSGAFFKFIPLYMIMIAMIVVSLVYYHSPHGALFTAGIMLLVPLYIAYRFITSASHEYEDYFSQEITYRFNELGIEGRVYGEVSFINYQDIYKFIAGTECFFIYVNNLICFFLPYRCFDEKTREVVVQLFDENPDSDSEDQSTAE